MMKLGKKSKGGTKIEDLTSKISVNSDHPNANQYSQDCKRVQNNIMNVNIKIYKDFEKIMKVMK